MNTELPESVLEPEKALRFREQVPALLEAIGSLTTYLERQYSKPHLFVSISSLQADASARVLVQQAKTGVSDGGPRLTTADRRSVFYMQGRYQAQLNAFLAVNGTALLEMLSASKAAVVSGHLLVAFGLLRGLIERAAHAWSLACNLRPIIADTDQPGQPLARVLEVSDHITRALYGTRVNWTAIAIADLVKSKRGDIEYRKADDRMDYSARGVLGEIDRLDRKLRGTRVVYEILCELLHPNAGDLFTTTTDVRPASDLLGTRLLHRTIGRGRKDFSGHPELDHILAVCCNHVVDVLKSIPEIHGELGRVHHQALASTQKYMRKALKRSRGLFSRGDLCPCLSGRQVTACCARTSRF